ncbi:glycoside hydrolase family protein [Escherichia coli]
MCLREKLKVYEGTKEYQAHMGYYCNGKFWVYKCSENKDTIGYGHLLKASESFSNGINEDEADKLLDKDIGIAKRDLSTLNLKLPQDWEDFMVIMIFQLGLGGTKKFKKMIIALQNNNYTEAIKQAKDSLWYRQTPNRLDQMIKDLINK